MSLVIDANMKLFAERMHITSSRMINDYGLSSIDEIIEAEAERGNDKAINIAREYYHSPEKLIKLFKLADVENKFAIIHNMGPSDREKVLPLLESEDLVMGLYFFTQDKLLEMMLETDIEELVAVVMEAFPLEQIVKMFSEEDLIKFFMNDDLEKVDVVEQLKSMPPEVMKQFVESITGMPANQTDPMQLINNISQLPDDKFHKFMASIDPDIQRQLTFQLTKVKPEYLTLFENKTYVDMMSTLLKPDMIKPMIMFEKETLLGMIMNLSDDFMSIVAAQVDEGEFAKFLQKGNMHLLEKAMMI